MTQVAGSTGWQIGVHSVSGQTGLRSCEPSAEASQDNALQAGAVGAGTLKQPLVALQPSAVHGSLSSQVIALPIHALAAHASPLVQAFPSSQLPLASVWLQPVVESQASAVQLLPSSQLSVVAVHWPPAQLSPVVHASPSEHGPLASV
jgi:hypothetical protein